MLKGQKYKIPLTIGAGVLLFGGVLGATIVGLKLSGNRPNNPISGLIQSEEPKSAVLRLVMLPQAQRAVQLEGIAQGEKGQDRDRARYLLASDLLQQGTPEKALNLLQGLEQDYPVLAPYVALKRAQAYEKMGEKEKAKTAWQEIIKTYPNHPVVVEALYVLGKENPQYQQQAIALFPKHPRTQEIIQQRLSKNPNQFSLLLLQVKTNPLASGMGAIRDRLIDQYASQLKPADWEAIADGYWNQREYEKAGKAYAKATYTPENLYRSGRGRQLEGKNVEAKLAYQQLIKTFPDAKETGLGLRRLAALSKSQDSLIYLDLVIKKFPDETPDALLSKAEILDAMGSPESASKARQLLLTSYGSSDAAAEYRWKAAKYYSEKGDSTTAWKWAQQITAQNPKSDRAAEAAYWVGKWASKLGRSQEAKSAFEYVLAQYPQSYYAWRSAVFLGWNVGDFTTVRQLVPQVVRHDERALPPAGSDTLKELYQLGQDRDAWTIWQTEFKNVIEPTVNEQFTDGLLQLAMGDHLDGINQIWNLSQREKPEEVAQWQTLRQQASYWHALYPFPFLNIIENWSQQRQLNPLLVTALIRQESRFMPGIRSVAGATGLMQVMPGTADWIADKIDLKQYDTTNPNDNVKLGTWYLDYTHQEYQNNSLFAVASYNAGPGNVAKWIQEYGFTDPDAFVEDIPFDETRGYVESVFANYWNYLRLYNPEIGGMLAQYGSNKSAILNP